MNSSYLTPHFRGGGQGLDFSQQILIRIACPQYIKSVRNRKLKGDASVSIRENVNLKNFTPTLNPGTYQRSKMWSQV